MRPLTVTVMAVLLLLAPLVASAQDNRAALDPIAKAMGAGNVKSIQYSGTGVNFQVGQNYSPDLPWTVKPTGVSLADNVSRPNLAVDQILPLHGRVVPYGDLTKAVGR